MVTIYDSLMGVCHITEWTFTAIIQYLLNQIITSNKDNINLSIINWQPIECQQKKDCDYVQNSLYLPGKNAQ